MQTCSPHGCDNTTCCEKIAQCRDFICPREWTDRIRKKSIRCETSGCTNEKCCSAPQSRPLGDAECAHCYTVDGNGDLIGKRGHCFKYTKDKRRCANANQNHMCSSVADDKTDCMVKDPEVTPVVMRTKATCKEPVGMPVEVDDMHGAVLWALRFCSSRRIAVRQGTLLFAQCCSTDSDAGTVFDGAEIVDAMLTSDIVLLPIQLNSDCASVEKMMSDVDSVESAAAWAFGNCKSKRIAFSSDLNSGVNCCGVASDSGKSRESWQMKDVRMAHDIIPFVVHENSDCKEPASGNAKLRSKAQAARWAYNNCPSKRYGFLKDLSQGIHCCSTNNDPGVPNPGWEVDDAITAEKAARKFAVQEVGSKLKVKGELDTTEVDKEPYAYEDTEYTDKERNPQNDAAGVVPAASGATGRKQGVTEGEEERSEQAMSSALKVVGIVVLVCVMLVGIGVAILIKKRQTTKEAAEANEEEARDLADNENSQLQETGAWLNDSSTFEDEGHATTLPSAEGYAEG